MAHGYRVLGFENADGGDGVFRDLALARIIEPTSKLDSARVPEEAGVMPASYPTVNRRLRGYARDSWRHELAAARAGMRSSWAALWTLVSSIGGLTFVFVGYAGSFTGGGTGLRTGWVRGHGRRRVAG